jgi:hypothetical protein
MEIQNKLRALGQKVVEIKDQIETEESTKTAFTLPFIQLLGYDVFNPTEVRPEFTADLGLKKGEKVDYAIFQDGVPILIIECKNWREKLDVHNSQLFRYFHVTKTRFALLTNGIEYRFYADLVASNKMDEKPFLEFDITNLKDSTINEITKFHKSNFDEEKIVNNASSLKYTKEVKKMLAQEIEEPSENFIRMFASHVYSGRLTSKVMEQFSDIVKRAVSQFISEKVNERLHTALQKEEEQTKEEEIPKIEEPKVITTEEELEGFRIVVAILRRKISKARIHHRDTQSYFGILLDDNNRQPICRLHLNRSTKYLEYFDENKKGTKVEIESVDDIYNYEQQLLKVIDYYEE